MSDLTIRTAGPEDLKQICDLNDLAFGGPDESRIVRCLEEDDQSLLSLIAETPDNKVAGHIQFFPIDVISTEPAAQFAGLGPMSVHPDTQRTGIGGALINAGLDRLKQQGIQRIFVLGHTDYYPRFGFSVDQTAGFAAAWGGPAFMAIQLNAGGPDFGELIYPGAFSE